MSRSRPALQALPRTRHRSGQPEALGFRQDEFVDKAVVRSFLSTVHFSPFGFACFCGAADLAALKPYATARGPALKVRSIVNFYSTKKPVGTTARTGEVCPESGVWQSLDYPSTTAPIAKGNRIPPHNGNAVTWKLIRHA